MGATVRYRIVPVVHVVRTFSKRAPDRREKQRKEERQIIYHCKERQRAYERHKMIKASTAKVPKQRSKYSVTLKMRTETILLKTSILTCALYRVTDAFVAPSASATSKPLVGYSCCASSLGYSPENNNQRGRQAPPKYYKVQDDRWGNPMGFDDREEIRPSWSQTEFASQNSIARERDMMNFEQFSENHQYRESPVQTNLGYGGGPNPSFGQREYQKQYGGEDRGQIPDCNYKRQWSTIRSNGRRNDQWNEPQIFLGRDDEDYFLRQTQSRTYDSDNFVAQNSYDQQPEQYYGYYENEQNLRSPRQAMRWPTDMGFEIDARGMMMSPLRGFEIIDRMLDDMLNGIEMINDVVDRLNFGMGTSMGQGQVSIENLLDNAYADLLADPAVAQLLGDSIRLGFPTAQSSSSYIVNGIRSSRIEMVVPIEGICNMGQLRLLANEDGILRLELGVGGRVINVQGGRSYNSQKGVGDEVVIDATVVE